MADEGDLAVMRARGERWLPAPPVRSLDEAAHFIDDVGFALLFPADRPTAPSLWEAVAGPDVEPFAHGMGTAESMVWSWKDQLPEAALAWYGRFFHQRASLLAPRLLAALYPGEGEPDDHWAFPMAPEAHQIAEALLGGAVPSSALRELVGHRGRYDRAIRQLQRQLLVTSAGVREQRTGWPAVVIDLTCRRFVVGGGIDHRYAAARFVDTVVETAPAELAKAYGWPTAVARDALDQLAASGRAERCDGRYRCVGSPAHTPHPPSR